MYPLIYLDKADYQNAEKHCEKMIKRRGLKQATVRDSSLIGYLGELAFSRFLDRLKKMKLITGYEVPPDDTGATGDEWDFLVMGHKIDVKASATKDEMIMDEWRATKAKHHGVLLVFIKMTEDLKEAELRGFAEASKLERAPEYDFKLNNKLKQMYKLPNGKLKLFKHGLIL